MKRHLPTFQISSNDVPLIVVGGGAILLDKSTPFQGVSNLLIPEHYQVRNFTNFQSILKTIIFETLKTETFQKFNRKPKAL